MIILHKVQDNETFELRVTIILYRVKDTMTLAPLASQSTQYMVVCTILDIPASFWLYSCYTLASFLLHSCFILPHSLEKAPALPELTRKIRSSECNLMKLGIS